MDGPSPARLYATLVGALLMVGGIVGFFYSASFGSPGEIQEMLGAFAVNGWLNTLHVLTGALGLLVAGYAVRQYALWIGWLYVALAVWGFLVGSGEAVFGLLPIDAGDNLLHLVFGAAGLSAALTTEKPGSSLQPDAIGDGP